MDANPAPALLGDGAVAAYEPDQPMDGYTYETEPARRSYDGNGGWPAEGAPGFEPAPAPLEAAAPFEAAEPFGVAEPFEAAEPLEAAEPFEVGEPFAAPERSARRQPPPPPAPKPAAKLPNCDVHPFDPSVALCSRCAAPCCETCIIDIPRMKSLCKPCALFAAGIRRDAPPKAPKQGGLFRRRK